MNRFSANNTIVQSCFGNDIFQLAITQTIIPFSITLIRPHIDVGVSKDLLEFGIFDPVVLGPLQFILQSEPCGNDSFFVDAGANIGFFSFFALSMDCTVVMFEPQRVVGHAVNATLCVNSHLSSKVDFIAGVISTNPYAMFPMNVQPYKKLNYGAIGTGLCSSHVFKHMCANTTTYRLDDLVSFGVDTKMSIRKHAKGTRIRVLKIDTEGYEPDVIMTGIELLRRRIIDNVLFEITPSTLGLNKNRRTFEILIANGYSIAHLVPFSVQIRDKSHPFYAEVDILGNNITSLTIILEKLIEGSKIPRGRGFFQTNFWASLNPTLFSSYNNLVNKAKNTAFPK